MQGGVPEYIARCPKPVQSKLEDLRSAIGSVATDAIETVSYFGIPGFSYEGFSYNGMFAWFSFKAPFVRIHIRPDAIVKYKNQVEEYPHSKAVISFDPNKPIPKTLVKKLVKASLQSMKKEALKPKTLRKLARGRSI